MKDDFVKEIQKDMERRRKALEDDLLMNVAIEDKIVTDRLAKIKGLQGHLQQAKMTRALHANQHVVDERSHAVVSRADLHKRYNF